MIFNTLRDIVDALKDAKSSQEKKEIVQSVSKDYISPSLQDGTSDIPLGSQSQDVKIIQSILAGLGYLSYSQMSGQLDQTTMLSIKKFAASYKKTIDISKPLSKDIVTIFSEYQPEDLQYISKKEREAAKLKYSNYTGSEYDFPPIPSDIKPLSILQAERLYGKIEWKRKIPGEDDVIILNNFVQENIISIDIPQLSKIQNPVSTRIQCHKFAAPYIIQLWKDWETAGLLHKIENFGGCLNIRTVRRKKKKGQPNPPPTNTLSNHAFGTAFDINTKSNARGKIPPIRGQNGCLRELVPYAYKLGFWWGGYFPTPDGMHFELSRIDNQILA